jgi:cell division protein FtsB
MNDLSIVEILKVGLSGLVFLIALLGYHLLRKEQEKDEPRDRILKTVLAFVLLCFIMALIVGGIELVKFFSDSSSDSQDAATMEKLEKKDLLVASQKEQIKGLESQVLELQGKQLTLQQKIDLGLYYTYPASDDKVEKRDSKKAREYLLYALKEHDKELNEPRKAEIVEGLVRIREKITDKEDFIFILKKIEEYRYGIEKELDLAKVYWAFANSESRNITKRRRKSLEHFMRAASEFEDDISNNDRKDVKTLIEVLKNNKGVYLRENGEKIIKNIEKNNKEKISRHLDELLNYWSSN